MREDEKGKNPKKTHPLSTDLYGISRRRSTRRAYRPPRRTPPFLGFTKVGAHDHILFLSSEPLLLIYTWTTLVSSLIKE